MPCSIRIGLSDRRKVCTSNFILKLTLFFTMEDKLPTNGSWTWSCDPFQTFRTQSIIYVWNIVDNWITSVTYRFDASFAWCDRSTVVRLFMSTAAAAVTTATHTTETASVDSAQNDEKIKTPSDSACKQPPGKTYRRVCWPIELFK